MPQIALIDSRDDNVAKSIEVDWGKLTRILKDVRRTPCEPCAGHDCPSKDGRAWIPAKFTNSKRIDANVEAVTFAVFDLDAPSREQLLDLAKGLHGHAYVMHETHAVGSYRLVLPLVCDVPSAQWLAVWQGMISKFQIPADLTCKNLSRHYYFPSKVTNAHFQVFEGEGQAFDWKALDPIFPSGVAETFTAGVVAAAKQSVSPLDPANTREAIDLDEMRRTVGSLRRPETRKMLDTILAGRRLTENFPADVGYRDAAVLQACAILATAPQGKPYSASAVLELLHGSIRAMETQPEGLEHWLDLAREKYLRKVGERLERDARSDAHKAGMFAVIDRLAPVPVPTTDPDDWRRFLIWGPLDKNGNPSGLRQTGANVGVILEYHPDFKGQFRFNALSRDIEVTAGPLAGKAPGTLDVETKNWLSASEFKLHLSSLEIREQIMAASRRHEYDPLRQWLESLVWDGTHRVENFFADYLSACGAPEYLASISRCFLIGAVARAMGPGCEMQNAPILVGRQGVGKSRALKALGQPFFTDAKINFADKDSQLLIAGHWIVELAELSGWRAVDTETIKGFISRSEDKFRPPYGRVAESFKRRCVFVGTTNEEEMLTDTENRRWWPVKVNQINVARVAKDRDQLFAQALVMYRQSVPWFLSAEESAKAAIHAEDFTLSSNARAEQILAWFAAKPVSDRPRWLTTFEVLNNIFAIPSASINKNLQVETGRALKHLGFDRARRRHGGELLWTYQTPTNILSLPHNSRPSQVELIKGNQ